MCVVAVYLCDRFFCDVVWRCARRTFLRVLNEIKIAPAVS